MTDSLLRNPEQPSSDGVPSSPDDEHVPGSSVAAASMSERPGTGPPDVLVSGRFPSRGWHERMSVRLLATVGVVGLATVLGAVLVSQNVAGWIVGLVVGVMSSVIAA